MKSGRVKFWVARKCYEFIVPDDGSQDYFVFILPQPKQMCGLVSTDVPVCSLKSNKGITKNKENSYPSDRYRKHSPKSLS